MLLWLPCALTLVAGLALEARGAGAGQARRAEQHASTALVQGGAAAAAVHAVLVGPAAWIQMRT